MLTTAEFNDLEVWVEINLGIRSYTLKEYRPSFSQATTRLPPTFTTYLQIPYPSPPSITYSIHVRNTSPKEWIGDLLSDPEIDRVPLDTAFLYPIPGHGAVHRCFSKIDFGDLTTEQIGACEVSVLEGHQLVGSRTEGCKRNDYDRHFPGQSHPTTREISKLDIALFDDDSVDPWCRIIFIYGTRPALTANGVFDCSSISKSPNILMSGTLEQDTPGGEILVPASPEISRSNLIIQPSRPSHPAQGESLVDVTDRKEPTFSKMAEIASSGHDAATSRRVEARPAEPHESVRPADMVQSHQARIPKSTTQAYQSEDNIRRIDFAYQRSSVASHVDSSANKSDTARVISCSGYAPECGIFRKRDTSDRMTTQPRRREIYGDKHRSGRQDKEGEARREKQRGVKEGKGRRDGRTV
ncbi:hypothetical protein IAR55_002378 [Kwoniella newhampshirensis]|uniref:Uncharacterized protein n=1 Tax=Kwoniella newhampshirensis TaxID=1651941 RepID=A0AAW0YZ37_9TREE